MKSGLFCIQGATVDLNNWERIRTIRKSNKLSQVEFANMVGISQGTLS
ncbi:helix-turn-helix transcriptional regulator [Paenibacillus algorifonticola]